MSVFISRTLPYVILISHILLPLLVLAVIYRKSWGRQIFGWIAKHSVLLAFLLSLSAVAGSLFYSEVAGYEPCTLCWWIRVFLYPQALIFAVALWLKDKSLQPFSYALPLTLASLILSLYFSYYSVGGVSLFPCTAAGGGCSRVFVQEFGYITIPMMAFTVSAYLLLLTWVNKVYKKESNTK